ncbi:MAG: SDR family oxidoreductase [Bacteroidales bacterium]|nr:SDR family oxidoreductase [Bacteroidales bacterium]
MGKIVITGASSGIGLAIAKRLASLGKPMILQYRKNVEQLSDAVPDATLVKVDFSDLKAVEDFAASLDDVEILVNAAAVTETGLLPTLETESIEKMISVNILATTLLCRAVLPRMCLKRKGVIVNISSVTAQKVYRGQSVYGGTKAYIETLSKGIAAECSKKGVRCNCVAPGSILSGTMEKLVISTAGTDLKGVNASDRFGTPDDVAAAVEFLCSDNSNYINGAVLAVNGGFWLGI